MSKESGVGSIKSSLLDELSAKFESRSELLKTILALKTVTLSEKLGTGASKALQLAAKVMEGELNISVKTVLKTDDAKKIYLGIIELIESCFSTNYSKNKIRSLYPLPSRYLETIMERQSYASAAKSAVSKMDKNSILWFKETLSNISSLKKPKTPKKAPGRVVITDDKSIYDKLNNKGVQEYCDIIHVSAKDMERLTEYLQNYESVIYVTDNPYYPEALEYADNVEILSSNASLSEIIPEKILSLFTVNYSVIKSACEVANKWRELNLQLVDELFSSKIPAENIRELVGSLDLITEGGDLKAGVDQEIDNLSDALSGLDKVIVQTETELNEYIKRKITASAVTIKGEQILSILQSSYDEVGSEKLKQYLPTEVIEIFDKAIQIAEDTVIKKLRLQASESALVEGLLPREIRLPVEVNRKKMMELESALRGKFSARKYQLIKNISKNLEKHTMLINDLLTYVQEFDFFLGLGEFAVKYGLNPPSISSGYRGVSLQGGVNLFLKDQELKGKLKTEPINYSIGETPGNTEFKERIVVLTGANSGGKSMCIELLAQIAILGQMGLLSPAQVSYMGLFDEIHFFAKSRGMVTAGALEASLKRFAKITSNEDSKLVLFDEVEAMTESGAAARILAAVIDILSENSRTCAILVSHLGGEIVKLTRNLIRVDGIEAEGLDEEMNLIVNRSPKYNYLARSTPELIVERLFNLSKGAEKKVYEKILSGFRDKAAGN